MNNNKVVNAAKYAGTSVTIGTAIGSLIIYMYPQLKDVETSIGALLIFAVNLILVKSGFLSD